MKRYFLPFAILILIGLISGCAGSKTKTFASLGGEVTFQLPDDWVVMSPRDDGTSYRRLGDDGVLLLTVRAGVPPKGARPEEILDRMAEGKGKVEALSNGARFLRFKVDSPDSDITSWMLTKQVGEELIVALYTYTDSSKKAADPRHLETLKVLDEQIRAVKFR